MDRFVPCEQTQCQNVSIGEPKSAMTLQTFDNR
jgi:hypothetical protein